MARGDNVEVTDLYAMKFKAVVGADDFQGKRADPDFLSVATEQTRAYQTGTLASGIVAEQKKRNGRRQRVDSSGALGRSSASRSEAQSLAALGPEL